MPSVLVVEDDTTTRKLIYYTLSYNGDFNVKAVGSGADAIAYIERCYEDIDIVISDLLLPDFSGFDLFKKYKDKLPFIIVTSLDSLNMISELKNMGVKEVIHKPFNFSVLIDACNRVLGVEIETIQKLEEKAKRIRQELEIYQQIKREKNGNR